MFKSVGRWGGVVAAGLVLTACQKHEGPVVARVGPYTITLADLKSRMQDTPAEYQQYLTTAEGRRQYLNLMIREKTVMAEAERLQVRRDPAYRKAVAKFKADWSRRLQDYQDTLLIDSTLRRLRSKELAATDVEVQKYYDAHRAEYDHPVVLAASHILLNSENDARDALARLKAHEPFDRVAREMSKDPATAAGGGKLDPFPRGKLPAEFEEAAFKLKTGEISGIVKTQFGFHIIKKTGQKLLPARRWADVQPEIRAKLEREKFNQWVTAKESLLTVKVDEPALSLLSLEESPKP
jgi:peptidyl-prolyl cis-trans isomerase C